MQDIKKNHPTVRIGTRGSPLALAQAQEVKRRLLGAHSHLTGDMIGIIAISTKGDRIDDRPLADIGGKGLFTGEIEAALITGSIDMAVHSLKDMPTVLTDNLDLGAILERQDVRDAFISAIATGPDELPARAVIGTASLRRQAQTLVQTLAQRPDITVISLRGNVQSRLKKLDHGDIDATYLAMAGLNRLGIKDERIHPLEVEDFLPAVAQAAIAIEIVSDNHRLRELLRPLNHKTTEICIRAERAMLKYLDGSCRTPIAGYATLQQEIITLKGQISLPDGSASHYYQATGADPEQLGIRVGRALKDQAGEDFFRKLTAGQWDS